MDEEGFTAQLSMLKECINGVLKDRGMSERV
jgi:hypothetical protein